MKNNEHSLQANIVELLSIHHILVFETDVMSGLQFFGHTDRRRFAFINHHKKMGYVKGQSDLVIVLNDRVVFVEVKKEKGIVSKEQKDFKAEIEKRGHQYLTWRSLDDCINFVMGVKCGRN
jgi:hypothetical protein